MDTTLEDTTAAPTRAPSARRRARGLRRRRSRRPAVAGRPGAGDLPRPGRRAVLRCVRPGERLPRRGVLDASRRGRPAPAHPGRGAGHLPRGVTRRQAGGAVQQPHRRVRDLGDGPQRQEPPVADRPRRLRDLPRRPDGRHIVFDWAAADPGLTDLYVVDTVTGELRLLHEEVGDVQTGYPVWSPDGTEVLFVRQEVKLRRGGVPDAGQRPAVGARRRQRRGHAATSDATLKDQTPDWSPDGSQITYAADDDIWLMDADGTDVVNLTPGDDGRLFGTAFSPRGDRIAFTGTGGTGPRRRAVRPDDPHRRHRPEGRRPHPGPAPGRPRVAAARLRPRGRGPRRGTQRDPVVRIGGPAAARPRPRSSRRGGRRPA